MIQPVITIPIVAEPGDNAFVRKDAGTHQETSPCTFCGKTGKISGVDGTAMECPKCKGKKTITKKVPNPATSEEVQVLAIEIVGNFVPGKAPEVRIDYKTARGWLPGRIMFATKEEAERP